MFGSQSNGNKKICQFYLQGHCKHGLRCWNIHQERGTGALFGGTSATQGGFSGFDKNTSSVQEKPFLEFIKQVGVEMNSWEKNGMWLLSSLAPLKDHPTLVGFSDTSPEELRVEAYDALKKNDPNLYQSKVKERLEFHKNLRQSLRSQTPEAIAALRNVFYKNGDNASASTVNAFGKSTVAVNSLFGKNSLDQPSLFGGNAVNQTSNSFTNANSNQSSSLFGSSGNSSNSNQAAGIFGGSNNLGSNQSAGLFGASNTHGQNQSSLFGTSSNSNIQNQSPSLFGGISNSSGCAQSANHFGASGSVTSPIPTTSLFGGTRNSTGSTGIFGAKSQNGAFGAAPIFGSLNSSGTSTFKVPTGESVFGGQSNAAFVSNSSSAQGSLFGNNTNASSFSSSQSVFGGSSQSPLANSLFGTQGNASTSLFGNLSNASSNPSGIITFGSSAPSQETQSFIIGGNESQNPSLFASTPPIGAQNVVGQESQASLFGGNPSQGSNLFGSNNVNNLATVNPIQSSSNVFGSNTINNQVVANLTQNASNVFGGNTVNNQGTENPTQIVSNVFKSNINSQATTNLSNNNASLFREQLNQHSSPANQVGSSNSGTLFGNTFSASQAANTLFGGGISTASGIQQPTPFSASNINQYNSGNPNMLNCYSESRNKVYTPLHLLTDEDRIEFERDVFYKIPLVPPPKELCVG